MTGTDKPDEGNGKPIHWLSPEALDKSAPTPLYHQLYLLLRQKITSGELGEKFNLLGEQELARHLDVSRITVKRALKELADAGLVTRRRGRGTFVAPGTVLPVVSGSFENLIESLHAMGAETAVELLSVTEMPADQLVQERLQLPAGAIVQQAIRLRRLKGTPFSYLVTYVPKSIADLYSTEELALTPMLALLERAGYTAHEAEQWITAIAAPPDVAAALDINIAGPLLVIERVMRVPGGEAVQFVQGYYHPERFRYHVTQRSRAV